MTRDLSFACHLANGRDRGRGMGEGGGGEGWHYFIISPSSQHGDLLPHNPQESGFLNGRRCAACNYARKCFQKSGRSIENMILVCS